MAGTAIGSLVEITQTGTGDKFAIVDISGAPDVTRFVTIDNLLNTWYEDTNAGGFNMTSIKNLQHNKSTATSALDFDNNELEEISISANTTFTGANYAIGRTKVLKIITDGTLRTLTFPSGWVFVGAKPTDQAASKTGILSLTCFTTAEAGVVASYGVQT